MEGIIDKELVLSDSDDDIDFTAKKKHGKRALRIDESDSEVETDLHVQDTEKINENNGKRALRIDESDSEVETDLVQDTKKTNEIIEENVSEENSEQNSNESKDESSDDGEKVSSLRKKKKRKKKSDEHRITDEVKLIFRS